jgi:HAD superfamily hydrolase (TIGR01490 family)
MSRKKIGAFFDIDGTLLPAPSLEWRFLAYLLTRDEISMASVMRWLGSYAKGLVLNPQRALTADKSYLAGLRDSLGTDWADSSGAESIRLFRRAADCLAWHANEGHRIWLVSGTVAPLALAIAHSLPGRVEVVATELEVRDDRWTGRLAAEHLSGEMKADAVEALAERYGLSLEESYAYGNTISDVPMLGMVGHATAVNPSARLERVARLLAWRIVEWRSVATAQIGRTSEASWGRSGDEPARS